MPLPCKLPVPCIAGAATALFAAVMPWIPNAHAQPAPSLCRELAVYSSHGPSHGPSHGQSRGPAEVLAYPDVPLSIQFPDTVIAISTPGTTHIDMAHEANLVLVKAHRSSDPGDTTTLDIHTVSGRWQLRIRNAARRDMVQQQIVVKTAITTPAMPPVPVTRPLPVGPLQPVPVPPQVTQYLTDVRRREEERWDYRSLVPLRTTALGGPLHVDIHGGGWRDLDMILRVDVWNPTLQPYIVRTVELALGKTDKLIAIKTYWPSPAALVKSGFVVIPPGERVSLEITAPNVAMNNSEITPLTLFVVGDKQRSGRKVDVWFEPVHAGDMDEFDAQQAQKRKDWLARGRVSLQLQALYGALWLPSPADSEDIDATSVKGLGLRGTYGFNTMLSVAAEIVGASSGKASYGEVMHEGMTGDLTQSAKLGRVEFSGMLQFGETVVPIIRAGLGGYGSSRHADFLVAGQEREAPETPFEVNGYWVLGAGADLRSGPVIAGVGLSLLSAFGDQTRSVELSVHIGGSWKP